MPNPRQILRQTPRRVCHDPASVLGQPRLLQVQVSLHAAQRLVADHVAVAQVDDGLPFRFQEQESEPREGQEVTLTAGFVRRIELGTVAVDSLIIHGV